MEISKTRGTDIPKIGVHKKIKAIIIDMILRSRLVQSPKSLDDLIDGFLGVLIQALRDQEALLCEKEVCQRYQFLTIAKLRNMRYRGDGPQHIKFGNTGNGRVFYRVLDIEKWISEHFVRHHLNT